MRIGLLGGTFDPIHNAHIAIAQAAVEKVGLDKVYVVPNDVAPHKSADTVSDLYHRYAMVALACQDEPKLVPAAFDYGLSYTVKTLSRLKALHPNDQLFYIMGIDAFISLPDWHEADSIVKMCDFVVSHRPGYPVSTEVPNTPFFNNLLATEAVHYITQVYLPLAATHIRTAVANNEMLSKQVLHPSVMEYIRKTGIYRKWSSSVAAS